MVDENILIENNLINETDLCSVIGEFLDNAIEAASQAVTQKVSINILNNGKSASIIIENTFKEKPNKSLNSPEFINAKGFIPGVQPASIV